MVNAARSTEQRKEKRTKKKRDGKSVDMEGPQTYMKRMQTRPQTRQKASREPSSGWGVEVGRGVEMG